MNIDAIPLILTIEAINFQEVQEKLKIKAVRI